MKYSEDYLMEQYGIIKIDDTNWYLLPDAEANTNDDEFDYSESYLEMSDFSELIVDDGDVLAVELNEIKEGYNITITNCNKSDSYGYINIDRAYELYDDDRYMLASTIAHYFREKNNVIVTMYLWRDEEYVEKYVDMLENYIEL